MLDEDILPDSAESFSGRIPPAGKLPRAGFYPAGEKQRSLHVGNQDSPQVTGVKEGQNQQQAEGKQRCGQQDGRVPAPVHLPAQQAGEKRLQAHFSGGDRGQEQSGHQRDEPVGEETNR